MRFLRTTALLMLVLMPGVATAEVTLHADVDHDAINMNERVTLTVTVAGDTEDLGQPKLPPLQDFVAVSTGSRQNLVISNGEISKSTSYTYNLMPRQTGNLVIGAVTLETPQGKLTTQPITVAVTQSRYEEPRRNTVQENGRGGRQETPEPFYVEATVDKDTVYLGEQVTYTFSFYRSAQVSETNNFTPPQTTGFISVDLPPQRKRTRVLNGETYQVVQVVTAMFPTRTGRMSIGPARLRVVPDVFSNLLGRDPFGWYRGQGRSPLTAGEPRLLATQDFDIHVRPLPPVPAGRQFSGAVGSCQLACSVSADSAGVGDPVTVTWTLSGIGRKDLVDAPEIQWPEGLETYPPTTELTTSTRNDVVRETKKFAIAVVPRQEGEVVIPSPELTYFDPEKGRYATARGRELVLFVGPPRAGITMVAPTQTISAAASTIRYLKGPPDEWNERRAGHPLLLFGAVQIVPPVLVALLFVWRRRSEAPDQRARGARLREMKRARKRLSRLSGSSDAASLAQEVATSFRQFLMARFDLSAGDLLDRQWTERLVATGCSQADISESMEVLQWTDRARFGGGGGRKAVTPTRVLALMQRLDKCAA